MLSKGKSPVRINQRPSKSIPRFLPAKLFVNVMLFSLWMLAVARNEAAYITSQNRLIWFANPALRSGDVFKRIRSAPEEVGITSSSFFELGQSFDYRSIIINTLTLMPLLTSLLSLYFLT